MNLSCQSPEALVAAAATNQVQWLSRLLDRPELSDQEECVASTATEVAAALGHCDVINCMYSCWDDPDLAWARQRCRFFLSKAIAGGHVAAFKLLLALCGDRLVLLPALEQAVTLGQQQIVSTTIPALNGKGVPLVDALLWTAKHGELNLMTCVLDTYPHAQTVGSQAAYRVKLKACSQGYLDMVQFLNEKYGQRRMMAMTQTPQPLAVAIAKGHMDVAEYLYTNKEFSPSFIDPAMSSAIDAGQLGLVKSFFDDGLLDASESVLGKAFVCAAGSGQLAIAKFLKSKSTLAISDFFFYHSFHESDMAGALGNCGVPVSTPDVSRFSRYSVHVCCFGTTRKCAILGL